MHKVQFVRNFLGRISGILGITFFGFLMSVVPQESHADARDVDPGAYEISVKSADENKKKDHVKDENKKSSKESDLEKGPLAKTTIVSVPANPDADENTKAILEYLTELPLKEEDRVISGQFIGHAAISGSDYFQSQYKKLVTDVEESTGESIGMVGADYAQLTENNPPLDLDATNQPLIDHWNEGGLVTVTWHARNPWTDGSSRDTAITDKFSELLTSGTEANKAWLKDLDEVAAGLAGLQDAGVTVLWRPLHESNGNAFWWSKASPKEFKELWKRMFDYFTEVKGLNNLLWVYSVVPKTSDKRAEDANYPGSKYVDITGLDVYAPELDAVVSGYNKLLKLKKPFGLTEYGPYKGSDAKKNPALNEPHFSYDHLIDEIRAHVPSTVFFQSWNHGHSLAGQLDAEKLLQDPWVTDAKDWK